MMPSPIAGETRKNPVAAVSSTDRRIMTASGANCNQPSPLSPLHFCKTCDMPRAQSAGGATHELLLPKHHRFATRRVLPRAIHESPLPLNPCRAHRMKWVIKGRKHGPDKQVPPNTDVTSRSLQIGTSKAGPTEAGPAEKDFAKVGRARLSCPVNGMDYRT